MSTDVSFVDLDPLKSAGASVENRANPGVVYNLIPNASHPILSDEKVRLAVQKSINREETFEQDQTTDESLEEELLRLTVRAASDLRSQGLRTRTVSVKLRDADFTTRQASRTLPEAVVADRVLFETARELLRRLRRSRRTPARLLGIALSSLVDGDAPGQLPLFDDPASASTETARDRALAEAVDRLRSKFGRDVIVPARLSGK